MNLVKCPRCDLNYIREDEKYYPEEMQTVYNEGRRKGESIIEEIKDFLNRP